MKRLIYILIGSVLTLILYGCASYNRHAALRRLRTVYTYETDELLPSRRTTLVIYVNPSLMTINFPYCGENTCGTYAWSNDTLFFHPDLCLWDSLNVSLGFGSAKDGWLIPYRTIIFRRNHTGDTLTDITSYADTFPEKGTKNMKFIFKR